jgi:transcription elongation factor SPT6
MEYAKQLWNKVTVAPWKKRGDADIDLDDESKLRVMACCLGPRKPAITFVILDSFGELVDVLHVGSIGNRSQGVTVKQKKKNDQQRQQVLKFMTDQQPHVVCLGASSYSCKNFKYDIYEVSLLCLICGYTNTFLVTLELVLCFFQNYTATPAQKSLS